LFIFSSRLVRGCGKKTCGDLAVKYFGTRIERETMSRLMGHKVSDAALKLVLNFNLSE